jgi:hypothetical protein
VVRYEGKRRTVVKHIGSAHDEDALVVLLSEAEPGNTAVGAS